jgi:hypothetical protein
VILLVAGSRWFQDYLFLAEVLDEFHKKHKVTELIHGGANGADTLAGMWAAEKGVPVKVFKADWNKYQKMAGPIRNEQMAVYLTEVESAFALLFWDGSSKGTLNMCIQLEHYGIDCKIIDISVTSEYIERLFKETDF